MFDIRSLMRGLGLLLGMALLVGAILLAETRYVGRTCRAIDLQVVDSDSGQQLVDAQALLQQLTACGTFPLIGRPMRAITTHHIEKTVQQDNFVRSCTAYKSWAGTLKVTIRSVRPIARLLHQHRASQYIDEMGTLLPMSSHGTARVLPVEVEGLSDTDQDLRKSYYGQALLALLNHIDQDSFWRAQVAHLHIDKRGKIVMRTQVGDQRIEWGQPEDIKEKFNKLHLFYQKVIPYKGWNAYKRVNLAFDSQIVCE